MSFVHSRHSATHACWQREHSMSFFSKFDACTCTEIEDVKAHNRHLKVRHQLEQSSCSLLFFRSSHSATARWQRDREGEHPRQLEHSSSAPAKAAKPVGAERERERALTICASEQCVHKPMEKLPWVKRKRSNRQLHIVLFVFLSERNSMHGPASCNSCCHG